LSALFGINKQKSYKDIMMDVMKSVNDKNKEQQMNENKRKLDSVKEIKDIYEPSW
jgi:hypothetical protein